MNARLRSLLGVVSVGALAVLGLACGSAPTDGDDAVSSSSEEALKARAVTDGHFTGADGKPVRYRTYEHAADEKAIVVFLNGRGEFVEKYDVLFSKTHEFPVGKADNDETLVNMPVSFVALDHEGQGDSKDGRIAGHVDNFEYFVKDVETLFATLPKLAQHKVPIIMVGHSMGGLIAARFAQDNQGKIDGLVLSSPMLKHKDPAPGLSSELLAQVAGFYALPAPYGIGMPQLCTQPPGVDAMTLAGIAGCHADPTLTGCFYNPGGDGCSDLTMCLLFKKANNCGMPPIPFAQLNGALQYLQTLPPGCQPTADTCPDTALTTDTEYCEYYYGSSRRAPAATMGWLFTSFLSQGAYWADEAPNVHVPVLLMTNGNDGVVDSAAHFCGPTIAGDCEVATFPGFGHELLSSAGREAPIAKIKSFINARIK